MNLSKLQYMEGQCRSWFPLINLYESWHPVFLQTWRLIYSLRKPPSSQRSTRIVVYLLAKPHKASQYEYTHSSSRTRICSIPCPQSKSIPDSTICNMHPPKTNAKHHWLLTALYARSQELRPYPQRVEERDSDSKEKETWHRIQSLCMTHPNHPFRQMYTR